MEGWFDLSRFDDVRRHSDMILKRVSDGSMPCDCPWTSDKIQLFRKWIDQGMPRSSKERQQKITKQIMLIKVNDVAETRETAPVVLPSAPLSPQSAQSFEDQLLHLRICSNEPEAFYTMMNLDL